MSITVYNYDPATLEYAGASEADESPLEPGEYLIPAHATTIVPPELIPGHILKWIGDGWASVELPRTPSASMPALSARQIRLGLVNSGFTLAEVSAVIDMMPDGLEKETALIEWEYATTFNRVHPLINTVGAALGLTDEQIDAMWVAALSL